MNTPNVHRDSPGWLFYVHAAFAASVGLTTLGIAVLPMDLWIKGYLGMGYVFTIGSTVTLCKTVRDQHEQTRLVNRLSEARTEKLLSEFTLKSD